VKGKRSTCVVAAEMEQMSRSTSVEPPCRTCYLQQRVRT
jgi:hypothetical protein